MAKDQGLIFKEVSVLTKQSNIDGALALLGRALHEECLDAEGCEKAGRLIVKLRENRIGGRKSIRTWLLGQCTTSWLANTLTALAWGANCDLQIHEGAYDSVAQELMAPVCPEERPQIVILLPWNQRLLSHTENRTARERLQDELDFWKQAWDLVRERTGAKLIQVGCDWITPGPLGHHLSAREDGDIDLVRRLNAELRAAVPPGSFFLELEQISGVAGRERFYDLRRYFWTKQPFSESGVHRLAAYLLSGIRALMTGPKKVLVLDLDNTLWGGVVGETGPLGITLGETPDGEAFRAFQHHVKALSKRGVILGICSKNNREDALAPFEQNPQMVLALSDFAHVEANWERKSEGLRRMAENLSLGLDSFVFFDDNPAEREEIRQALPEVEVVEVPADPTDYIPALESGYWFEAVELSSADLQRSAQYQRENQRREMQKSFSSMEDYLQSLEMRGSIASIDDTNIQRVVQLLGKTNQFNLTTRRHSVEDVRRMLAQSDSLGLVFSLEDKFGDHGLISVLLAVPDSGLAEKTLRIDTWLMSCRVISRTAEQFLFNELLRRARESGYTALTGEYIPTRKNALVADLLDRLAFSRIGDANGGTIGYRLSLHTAKPASTFVQPALEGRPAVAEV
jgi:FkbH-like protein